MSKKYAIVYDVALSEKSKHNASGSGSHNKMIICKVFNTPTGKAYEEGNCYSAWAFSTKKAATEFFENSWLKSFKPQYAVPTGTFSIIEYSGEKQYPYFHRVVNLKAGERLENTKIEGYFPISTIKQKGKADVLLRAYVSVENGNVTVSYRITRGPAVVFVGDDYGTVLQEFNSYNGK